jgi:hypothetical protein
LKQKLEQVYLPQKLIKSSYSFVTPPILEIQLIEINPSLTQPFCLKKISKQ